jgi:restriction endonuclease
MTNLHKEEKIHRYTKLPVEFQIPELNVETWNDLNFLVKSKQYQKEVINLIKKGFNPSTLDNIE